MRDYLAQDFNNGIIFGYPQVNIFGLRGKMS